MSRALPMAGFQLTLHGRFWVTPEAMTSKSQKLKIATTRTGTSVVPRVLALTHRHLHKSPSVRQPFVEISGSIAFSPLWFLSRKLCPIFVCQFKGSLHGFNWTPIFREGSSDRILVLSSSPVHSSACLTSRWQSRKQSDRSLTRLNLRPLVWCCHNKVTQIRS